MLSHPNAYGVVFGYQMLQKQNPQLNSCMKTEVNSITKSTDRKLARMQTFVLDSLGPLTSVIESDNQRGSLSHIEVLIAVKIAVQLIGNTNPQIYHHCMEVTSSFKKGLQEDENFKETVPLLFGPDFAKKSKEYIDQVKTMRSAIPDLNLSNSFLKYLLPPSTSGEVMAEIAHSLPESNTRVNLKSPTDQREELWSNTLAR